MSLEEYLSLDERYGIFGDYKEEAIEAYEKICASPEDSARLQELTQQVAAEKHGQAFNKYPKEDKPAVRFFAIASNIMLGRERYIQRGFSGEEADSMFHVFGGSANICYKKLNQFGYDVTYLWWCGIFVTAEIFKFQGKELEMKTYDKEIVWLKHKATDKLEPLYLKKMIHRSGNILGAGGCADEEGSYLAEFCETEEAYIGNATHDGLIDKEPTAFPKSEWEIFLQKGDEVIGFHFPRNTDLSREALKKFFHDGREAAKKYYPDANPKCYFCSTWLLDPKMKKMLKPESNIIGFQEMMVACPLKSDGMSVFGFVFAPNPKDYESLPENTSLERALKKLYLEGGRIYNQFGARLFDEE